MKRKINLGPVLLVPTALAVLLVFTSALSNLQDGRISEGRQQLEDAVRRSAVACYAAEGIYPPNLEYLEEHYGIQVDRERYTVMYEIFASNLMPDVTVLENG
ncbi:MAG: hypothetical protein IKU81_07710 [Oscillibacter sp.]|nr:hypothetical protein [Oscillibacter sp.]